MPVLGVKRFVGKNFEEIHRHQHLTSYPLHVRRDDNGMAVFGVGANNDGTTFRAPELLAHVGGEVTVNETVNLYLLAAHSYGLAFLRSTHLGS